MSIFIAIITFVGNIPGETRMGRDGFTRSVSTGQPLFELFG